MPEGEKFVWVDCVPFDKETALAALESGADALLVEEGVTPRVKELGRIKTVAPDGDIVPGRDVEIVEVASKEDERRAAAVPRSRLLLLRMKDWEIIPLENLIASRGGIVVEVSSEEKALTMLQVLEKGADGILVSGVDASTVRKITSRVKESRTSVVLQKATISEITPLGMGDRVCVDTCSLMGLGEGMLVGNASSAMFLVHAESVDNPYVEKRPFRVNAGAVHAYTLVPGGRTCYLSELKAGSSVLIVSHDGAARRAYVGRCKVERRPMLLVRGTVGEKEVSLVLQNAETIRLVGPDGTPVSVAELKVGDEVLAHVEDHARHFGMKVDETIEER